MLLSQHGPQPLGSNMNLEQRIAKMEAVAGRVNLAEMSDAELSAHISTLPYRSVDMWAAIIALVHRKPSQFPIVKCVPHGMEHEEGAAIP